MTSVTAPILDRRNYTVTSCLPFILVIRYLLKRKVLNTNRKKKYAQKRTIVNSFKLIIFGNILRTTGFLLQDRITLHCSKLMSSIIKVD